MRSQTTDLGGLLEAMPDALVGVDRTGVIRCANHLAESLFGYPANALVGLPLEDLMPQSHRSRHREARASYSAAPGTRSMGTDLNLLGLRQDGTEFPVDVSLTPTGTGEDMIVLAAVRDMTRYQDAGAKAAQLMKSVVEHTGEAIITSTLDGIITSWNPAAERLFGYSSEEIVGKSGRHLSPGDQAAEISGVLARISASQPVKSLDTERVRKDGTVFPAILTISPIRDRNGQMVGASAIIRDVTEQRRSSESDQRMAAIVEHSSDAISSSTPDGIVMSWNPAAERIYGYSAQEMVGKPVHPVVPADRADELKAILSQVSAGETIENLETIRVRKDGSHFPVSLSVSPIRSSSGAVIGASVVSRDVTQQRQAMESARRLADILEQLPDAVITTSLDGNILSWNPAAEEMFGYTSEEIIGRPGSLLGPSERAGEISDIITAIAGGERTVRIESVRVRTDGTVFPVTLTSSPICDSNGAVTSTSTTIRDVTYQKRTFESARSMIEASLDSFVAINPEGTITDANRATVRMTGVPRHELIGTPFSGYFTNPERAREVYRQVFTEGKAEDFPLTIRHKDGPDSYLDVLYNASVYRDPAGNVLGAFAAARDVTEQRKAAQYARSLIEASLDPMVTISPEGTITDANEATVRFTGVPHSDLIGTSFSDYFTDTQRANEGYQLVFEQGSVTDYPLTLRHRDETLTEVLYNSSLYRDAAGNVLGVFASARDVTRQVQAQRALAEQQARELERLAELERFQRLTVGRELKMIELKKQIEYLRKHSKGEGGRRGDQH